MQHLTITPSVPVWRDENYLVFDRKYYDGILLYLKLWGGKLTCVMNISDSGQPDFGVVKMQPDKIPFDCVVLEKDDVVAADHIKDADIVLASGDSFKQFHVSKLCNKLNIKCVYIIENIPETRYQIASMSTRNHLVKLRRYLYIWNGERKRHAAFARASGLQSNGMPAYKEYKSFNNILLYFDTRIEDSLYISEKSLSTRLEVLKSKITPLRLSFSGRLIAMKGADHLIELAKSLDEIGVNYLLNIYGSGDQVELLERKIIEYSLGDKVVLHGSVSFEDVLLPAIQNETDIFICCHRQSDPSCTYMETLSCGVPIVGYNNKAFSGILELADVGWGVDINDVASLAKTISYLDVNRDEICNKSYSALAFSKEHSFEGEFNKRIEHLFTTLSTDP